MIVPHMPKIKKGPLTLSQLQKRALFKVTKSLKIGDAELTVEGVYEIGTAKADYGRSIKVHDLAGVRKIGTSFTHTLTITIPFGMAKDIEVYKLPLFSD
jgi:hypothetical protein